MAKCFHKQAIISRISEGRNNKVAMKKKRNVFGWLHLEKEEVILNSIVVAMRYIWIKKCHLHFKNNWSANRNFQGMRFSFKKKVLQAMAVKRGKSLSCLFMREVLFMFCGTKFYVSNITAAKMIFLGKKNFFPFLYSCWHFFSPLALFSL